MDPRSSSTCKSLGYTSWNGWVRHPSNVVAHPGVKKEVPDLDDSKEVLRLPVAWAQTLIESPVISLERRARYGLAFTSGMRDGEIAGVPLKFLQLDAVEGGRPRRGDGHQCSRPRAEEEPRGAPMSEAPTSMLASRYARAIARDASGHVVDTLPGVKLERSPRLDDRRPAPAEEAATLFVHQPG